MPAVAMLAKLTCDCNMFGTLVCYQQHCRFLCCIAFVMEYLMQGLTSRAYIYIVLRSGFSLFLIKLTFKLIDVITHAIGHVKS